MENYKELSFSFREMLSRTKIIKDRQNYLENMMCDYSDKSLVPREQLLEMQLELEGIQLGLKYREFENERTVIMLKISLYKQRMEKIKLTLPTTNFNIEMASNQIQSHIEIRNRSILSEQKPNNEFIKTHCLEQLTSTNTVTNAENRWPLVTVL